LNAYINYLTKGLIMKLADFAGNWNYQSYRPEPVSVLPDSQPPTFVCWSPPGLGKVTIDQGGATGLLVFTGTAIQLKLRFELSDEHPGKLSISAAMDLTGGKQYTFELQGWVVPETLKLAQGKAEDNPPYLVRGSIVQTSADIAPTPQPIFTTGFFVLQKA